MVKIFLLGALLLASFAGSSVTHAQETPTPYSSQVFFDDASAIKWETATAFMGATALGIATWEWGSQYTFKTHSEGWFGEHTKSGGADKLGHAFSSYATTNVLTERLIMQGRTPAQAALTSALITQSLMLYVEVLDGYSRQHGFSWEDAMMNLMGSTFAYARHANPCLRDLIDFRVEYERSGYKGFDVVTDYSGQKYLLALKLSGINTFRSTPLRYLELQAGYFTRGFSDSERKDGVERSRHTFVGIGINASELFFGPRKSEDSGMRRLGRGFFEHIQIPHTAIRSDSSY
jgi:hypothetical protein